MILSRTFALLATALVAKANQVVLNDFIFSSVLNADDLQKLYDSYPDYSLDLNERRLVQLGPDQPPVTLTELQKVHRMHHQKLLNMI